MGNTRYITRALASATLPLALSTAWADPIEASYNTNVFKASHNSYARHESLANQIDDYNVWQIELDVFDYDGKLYVNHDCTAPFTGDSTVEELLQSMIANSKTYVSKFTMIYLDMKGGNSGDGCRIGWGSTLQARLRAAFEDNLPQGTIYRASDFLADGEQWPSLQELVLRRHLNWAIIVDWHGNNPTDSDDLLFFATSKNPPPTDASSNTILVNVEAGCDASPTSETPPDGSMRGRWVYRGWPSGGCSADCDFMSGPYWDNLLSKKYNYIATNCVDHANTFDRATHSPMPMFVGANNACPPGLSSCEWGTLAFPMRNLPSALDWASPETPLILSYGTYQVSTPSKPFKIEKSVTLQAPNGRAILR